MSTRTCTGRCSSVAAAAHISRRSLLAVVPLLGLATPLVLPVKAEQTGKLNLPNKEVDDATSPYIQDLLRKTAEKKDERKQERLDDYYRRNFKDYLDFEAGAGARARGLSTETAGKIAKWLEENE